MVIRGVCMDVRERKPIRGYLPVTGDCHGDQGGLLHISRAGSPANPWMRDRPSGSIAWIDGAKNRRIRPPLRSKGRRPGRTNWLSLVRSYLVLLLLLQRVW